MRADPQTYIAYPGVFHAVMANVQGFTAAEFSAMLSFIMDSDGGFMDMGHYYRPVFLEFFSGRNWTWSEYDYWERTYAEMGVKPEGFQTGLRVPVDRAVMSNVEDVLNYLKVADLKALLEFGGITAPAKTKKKDLVLLVGSIPDLHKTQMWKEQAAQRETEIGYPLYSVLMRHIAFKAKQLFNRDRCKGLGLMEFEHRFIEHEDERFVKLALKRDPQALPPYFPGDGTMLQPVIPGFDDDH